jgi:long-chain fatty acid transport protein
MKRLLPLLLLPALAHANALDTFGLSARSTAMAGAVAADVRGWAATHHNPGAIALTEDVQGSVSYGGAVMGLRINGTGAGVTSPRGTSLGLAIPLKLRSWNFALGVAVYIPDQFVVRIRLRPATEPQFALQDNALQHVVVTTALSVRPVRWLSLGAGASILADAAGNGITFDVGVVGGEKVGKASLDVALPPRAAPVAGILVMPTNWLRVGASYRGQLDLALKLDVLANVNIAGVITGDTFITLRAVNFYTPQKVSLGLAADPHRSLTLSAQVDWVNWSAFRGGLPDLRVLVKLDVSPPVLEATLPETRFRDQWVPRFSAEWRRELHEKVGLAARVGYAYEPNAVPDQTGLTSFADNDRHVVALGAGIELRHITRVLEKPWRLDLAFQYHHLAPRTTVKDPARFPGAGFTSDGYMAYLSATLEGRF